MFTDRDLLGLITLSGVYPMSNGWQVMIDAHWTDVTPQRPHGLRYALILQDETGDRLLGFDNSHGFDGAASTDRFDHEHRAGRVGRRYEYRFTTASALVGDFFARAADYCASRGVPFDFDIEEEVS
jgi:hypothetical protein